MCSIFELAFICLYEYCIKFIVYSVHYSVNSMAVLMHMLYIVILYSYLIINLCI